MAATAQHAVLLLLLVGGGLQACAAKRLVAFGDSITDNGNGTNLVVQAFYSKLLGRPVTATYPPGPFFDHGRWSNGPTWAEYLGDMVGYELHDQAIGSAVTNASISSLPVGDFYPDSKASNKQGLQAVPLPTFQDEIDAYLASNTVSAEDVLVVEIGVNDLIGYFERNILQALLAVEKAPAQNFTVPAYVVPGVAASIMQGLETLYAAGGRKFLVWELIAADVIPIFNHVNKLVNDVNAILDAAHAAAGQKLPAEQQLLPPDQFCAYVAAFVDSANAAIQQLSAAFAAVHADVQLVLFPVTALQRGFVADYKALGFVNAVDGCTSDLTFTQYAFGNLYSLADPTFTAGAAQATLYLSPLLVSELNKLQADTHGQNGPDSVPASVTEWSQRLLDILTGYLTETNTIGHLAGAILTSLPIGLGGFNPYSFVPSCLLQAGDHLYHDEIHPTTRQHALIAKAVHELAGHLFT